MGFDENFRHSEFSEPVGDLSAVRMNMPNGQGVEFKYDDLSLSEKDLVKIVGRMPVGIGVVADNRFVLLKK